MGLGSLLKNPFSFLFSRSRQEERLAEYVIREHGQGRSLNDIFDDPYLRNRTTEAERQRLLDRPEVIRALGESAIESLRSAPPA